jgi:ABC-type uncharacterized transport system ATPase subunit
MRVELRDIEKNFGDVRANAGITLDILPATIHGVLGENGAGKSTLMKILSGFISPDSGQIILDGVSTSICSPSDAIQKGIGMLHQDPLDFPTMRVLDDFVLGRHGGLLINRRAAARDFRELATRFEFDIDPDTYIDTLTVGERQQLEILRLLWLGAKVLILDEPTTGISLPQKKKLFMTLKQLASEGMTVLFVSHKLEDVESLCDRATILRQGKLIGIAQPPYNTKDLVSMMFGKEVALAAPKRSTVPGKRILAVKGMSLESPRLCIDNVSIAVSSGEVIGLAGMEGSGQALFLNACAGIARPSAGNICLDEADTDMTGRSYLSYKRSGVAYLPAARLEQGLVPGMTLSEHFTLAEGTRGLFVDRHKAAKLAEERIATFNIKGRPESPVESLSGGNQQRTLLALLRSSLSLILVEHPTRGLDIDSTIYIWGKLKERCAQGTAIVFISADLDEILQYSDRILVFFAGRVSPPLDATALDVDRLGELIGGKGWEGFEGERADA